MPTDPIHDRLLRIALSLPETTEDWPWGSIHCKVAGKIFVGWSRTADGVMSLGLRTNPELQAMLVASDPRFSIAKYTGKYGGIDVRLAAKPDWNEIEELIVGSFRIVAPKKIVAAWDAGRGAKARPGTAARREGKSRGAAATETPSAQRSATGKPVAKKVSGAAKKPASKPASKKTKGR